MKKILFVTAYPPCSKTAGQDYSKRLIQDLVNNGYEVDLFYGLYPAHDPEIPEKTKIIGTFKPSYINCLLHIKYHPLFSRRFSIKTLKKLQSFAPKYDLLYFDFSQVHLFSLFIEHPCKILMCQDVNYQKFERQKSLTLGWIKKTEGKILKQPNCKVFTFSRKDCDLISKLYNVTSNNVNQYLKSITIDKTDYIIDKNYFVFFGAWNRLENVEGLKWFIKEIYPKLPPSYKFDIVGGGATEETKQYCTRKNVSFTGFVNEPLDYIKRAQAMISPLRQGAGTKNKVLDAMCTGTPIIGTETTFEGIEDNSQYPLFHHAEKVEDFIRQIINWKSVSNEYKILSAQEFISRFNSNHFIDYIN